MPALLVLEGDGAGKAPDLEDAAEEALREAGIGERVHDLDGAPRRDELQELGADPLARQHREAGPLRERRREAGRIERAFPVGGVEAEEAQDAQVVLANARRRLADEDDAMRLQIRQAADVVVHRPVGADREGVDGEVAPLRVGPEIAPEADRGAPAMGLDILAQGRDLIRRAVGDDGHGAVRDPGRHRLEARRLGPRGDGVWRRRRREVDVGDRAPEKGVAHRAADDARLLAVAVERRDEALQRRARQELGEQRAIGGVHRNCPGTTRPFSRWGGTNPPSCRSAVSPV